MKYLMLCVLLTSQFSTFSQSIIHGRGNEWGPEIELPKPPLADTIAGFLYGNMATFSNGKRVVFMYRNQAPKGIYFTESTDGFNWSTPIEFGPTSGITGASSLKCILDENDTLHVIFKGQMPLSLYYVKTDINMNAPFGVSLIADNPANNEFNDMYITYDLKGRIHVMWNEGDEIAYETECYYSRSIDGGLTWETKQTISPNDNNSSAFPRGQFNAYDGDTLVIGWREKIQLLPFEIWQTQLVMSINGGASWDYWSSPNIPSLNNNVQGDPDVVIGPDGRIHLFYHEAHEDSIYDGMRVVYGYSDDLCQTWTPSNSFYNDGVICYEERSYLVEGSRFDPSKNVLWTFWKEEDLPGKKGGDMVARFSLDNGENWETIEYVTDRGDTTVGFKAISFFTDGTLAINYELPDYPDSALKTLYYAERTPLNLSLPKNASSDFLIYPNPCSGQVITISGTSVGIKRIIINDLSGKTFLDEFVGLKSNEYAISTDFFNPGIYTALIQTVEGNIVAKKFIIL